MNPGWQILGEVTIAMALGGLIGSGASRSRGTSSAPIRYA
jgi:hypothetical protein